MIAELPTTYEHNFASWGGALRTCRSGSAFALQSSSMYC